MRTNDNEWKTQEEVASAAPGNGIREENELNLMDPVVFPESFRGPLGNFVVFALLH